MKKENMSLPVGKQNYEVPALTIVNFKAEKGYASSSIQQPNAWEEEEW